MYIIIYCKSIKSNTQICKSGAHTELISDFSNDETHFDGRALKVMSMVTKKKFKALTPASTNCWHPLDLGII